MNIVLILNFSDVQSTLDITNFRGPSEKVRYIESSLYRRYQFLGDQRVSKSNTAILRIVKEKTMTLYYSQAIKSFLNTICYIDIEITSESHGRISFECTFLEFAAAKTGKISLFYRKVRYIERVFQFGDYNLVRYIEKFVIPKFAIPRVWIIKKNISENSGIRRKFAISRGSLYRRYVISRVDCTRIIIVLVCICVCHYHLENI